jgi:proteasome alpha subunit
LLELAKESIIRRHHHRRIIFAERRAVSLHGAVELEKFRVTAKGFGIGFCRNRIAFAAVGKYNEFENLRVAGVRLADLRGYSYDRRDVTGRSLATAYAQTLGTIFTEAQKPYEVELVVAEVGETANDDQIYRLTFDGSVADEHGYVAMGGSADAISTGMSQGWVEGMTFEAALRLAVDQLAAAPVGGNTNGSAEPRTLTPGQLEVAVLERSRDGRKFRRISGHRLAELFGVVDDSDAAAGDPL